MNIVKGTKFTAAFPIYTGAYPNSRFSHNATVTAIVTKESYGIDKGQHTFSFEILESDDADFEVGESYRKKGRNMYPNISKFENPVDYDNQAADKARRSRMKDARKNNF